MHKIFFYEIGDLVFVKWLPYQATRYPSPACTCTTKLEPFDKIGTQRKRNFEDTIFKDDFLGL